MIEEAVVVAVGESGQSTHVDVDWLSAQLPNPEDQREYARWRAFYVVTEAIADAMERADLKRSEVAEILGKSRGHVSQLMSGRRNMTLRTLADLLWACKVELDSLSVLPLGHVRCTPETAFDWVDQFGQVEAIQLESFSVTAGPRAGHAEQARWAQNAFVEFAGLETNGNSRNQPLELAA